MPEVYKLNDVFGLSRDLPLTYVSRPSVDNRFVEDITRDKHIVVHGSSKQGKTSLRRRHLKDKDFIAIQCTREISKARLYEMILKKAEVPMSITSTSSTTTSSVSSGEGEVEGSVPFFAKAKVSVATERGTGGTNSSERQEFEIDLADPNDIVRSLQAVKFSRIVVLEDFHYLEDEVQRSLSQDLKVFYESSKIVFMIIGVWLEANKLLVYNGDLSGRTSTIDADRWQSNELRGVITTGERLLNFNFNPGVADAILDGCQSNVGVVQEVCHRLCESAGLHQTSASAVQIGAPEAVKTCFREIADAQAARYENFLSRFAEGLNSTTLEMYKHIARVVVESSPADLRGGLRASTIFQKIAATHPSGSTLQQNNVGQALQRVDKVQLKHKLQPFILDYADGRLRVVDASFLLYLETHSKTELLAVLGFGPESPRS